MLLLLLREKRESAAADAGEAGVRCCCDWSLF
jgi:hypothetical protein